MDEAQEVAVVCPVDTSTGYKEATTTLCRLQVQENRLRLWAEDMHQEIVDGVLVYKEQLAAGFDVLWKGNSMN